MLHAKRTSLVYPVVLLLTIFLLFVSAVFAAPAVTVISPTGGGSVGSPIFYEAYATSAGCAGGISAIRIYTAPHVSPFTANGSHLQTFIKLNPGTYETVVQAFDNCGGVAKANVDITVDATAHVTVFLPSARTAATPVHLAASAQSPDCAAGINAIRIYTADHTSPYTVNSNQLDTYLNFFPNNVNFTVQAFDNCGKVFKAAFTEAIATTNGAFLYGLSGDGNSNFIYQVNIGTDGSLKNPNGKSALPTFKTPSFFNALTVDPGGWFIYAVNAQNIFGWQVNRTTGALTLMPDSFPLDVNTHGSTPWSIDIDPSGNFLFVTYREPLPSGPNRVSTYRINRSTGALTFSGFSQTALTARIAFDMSGQYLYGISDSGTIQVRGYRINPNIGTLSPLPGFPMDVTDQVFSPSIATTGKFLYIAGTTNSGPGRVFGYDVDLSSGMVTPITTRFPFSPSSNLGIFGLTPDFLGRFIWSFQQQESSTIAGFQPLDISSDGGMVAANLAETDSQVLSVAPDRNGKFVFTDSTGNSEMGDTEIPGFITWTLDDRGNWLNPVIFQTANSVGGVAAVRADPN
jgi:6-phosphogluconolactonase (cycloisomerase 2 family)